MGNNQIYEKITDNALAAAQSAVRPSGAENPDNKLQPKKKIGFGTPFDFETTVVSISKKGDFIMIYCDPTPKIEDSRFHGIFLNIDHDNYIEIYNALKISDTYKFKCNFSIYNDHSILNILEIGLPSCLSVICELKGLLDINKEYSFFPSDWKELVVFPRIKKCRLVFHKRANKIIPEVGLNYNIIYEKRWGFDLYYVSKISIYPHQEPQK